MEKVYIELVFLDNFVINLLIIFFASTLTKAKKKWGRFVLAAAVGGVYACAVFGINGFAISIVTKIAVSLAMCFSAYYAKGGKGFFKTVCAFYVVTFITAGAVYACMFGLGGSGTYGGAIVVTPAIRFILIGLAVSAALNRRFLHGYTGRMLARESLTVEMVLSYKARQARVKAFVDTGNMLTEPLFGAWRNIDHTIGSGGAFRQGDM